ncbi:MAG: hypothetical protein NTV51_20890 [Verrucomicrobia bacterium]|nr:hypothetical protein [Verrucomicrobiota bacterium]
MVEKRPWWRTLSFAPVFAGVRRFHLPLGAAAVLAVTLFSVRGYHSSSPSVVTAPVAAAPVASVESTMVAASVATTPAVVVATPAESFPVASSASALAVAEPSASSHFVLSSEATPSGGLTQMIPLVGAPTPADDYAPTVAPGTRLIAENFSAIQASETKLAQQFLSPDRGFETRALPARAKPVEPLAQMKVPSGGSRRSYLIASATLASTTTPVLTSDRSTRGLSDERLYDQISRVNARGAGVLVKF